MNSKNILVGAILLCVSFFGGVLGAGFNKTEAPVGGLYNTNPTQFVNGFSAGTSNQFSVTSAGAVTAGTLTSTGITSTGEANVFGNAASSTLQLGGGFKSGCLILGDSANATSAVYIIASGSTVTASTTKPAACQTVQ